VEAATGKVVLLLHPLGSGCRVMKQSNQHLRHFCDALVLSPAGGAAAAPIWFGM
jgi:hypothetical protein